MNFFNTLNEALDAEEIVPLWPLGSNISYGQTVSHVTDGIFVSVYRDERGMYERPIHYKTKREDM